MARSCVFCLGSANSKEHAYPNWLIEVMPGEGHLRHGRADDAGALPVSWENSGFDVQVRQVCRPCNQTWMGDIEAKMKPLLSPLVLGTRKSPLSIPEQKRIATWGYKTAIMLALAHPKEERFVPANDYRHFYEHRVPPDGTYIWIGGVNPDLGTGVYQAAYSKSERTDHWKQDGTLDRQGYRLSFSVNALVFQVVKDPYGARLSRPREIRDCWTRLRPISKGTWPPGRYLRTADLFDLHNGRFIPT